MLETHFLADRIDDVAIVARWWFDEWGYQLAENSFEKTCERIRGKLNKERPPLHIVAVDDGRPVGAAQLKLREMDIFPEREHWLGSVYVASNARGRGVGAILVQRIEQLAASLGVADIFLQTEQLDGGLYARLGWQPVEQVQYNGLRVLVMCRRLNQQQER